MASLGGTSTIHVGTDDYNDIEDDDGEEAASLINTARSSKSSTRIEAQRGLGERILGLFSPFAGSQKDKATMPRRNISTTPAVGPFFQDTPIPFGLTSSPSNEDNLTQNAGAKISYGDPAPRGRAGGSEEQDTYDVPMSPTRRSKRLVGVLALKSKKGQATNETAVTHGPREKLQKTKRHESGVATGESNQRVMEENEQSSVDPKRTLLSQTLPTPFEEVVEPEDEAPVASKKRTLTRLQSKNPRPKSPAELRVPSLASPQEELPGNEDVIADIPDNLDPVQPQLPAKSNMASNLPPHDLDEDAGENSNDEYSVPISKRATEFASPRLENEPSEFIQKRVVKEMWSIVNQIGTRKNGDKVEKPIAVTKLAKLITRGGERMVSRYEQLAEIHARDEPDIEQIGKLGNDVAKILTILHENVHLVLTETLGDIASDTDPRTIMLRDIYLHITPELMKVLDAAISLHQKGGSISTSNLEEITTIVKLLRDLLVAAKKEPSSTQPKAPPNQSYQLSQPGKKLVPLIIALHDQCRVELHERELTMKKAKAKRIELARARKRKRLIEENEPAIQEGVEREMRRKIDQELERQRVVEEAVRQRTEQNGKEEERIKEKIKQRRREQAREWKLTQPLRASSQQFLALPSNLSSQLLNRSQTSSGSQAPSTTQITLAQKRATKKQEAQKLLKDLERVNYELRQLQQVEDREPQHTTDGDTQECSNDSDDEGRLHMFGEKRTQVLRPAWTNVEMETLVEELRQERGKDRYDIISSHLDRSLDEIFARAKEFREAMEESREAKRKQNPKQYYPPLEPWIECIGKEF